MEPQNIRFGGGATSTVLHPFVAFAMLIAIVLIFLLPRKQIIVPFLLIVFLVPLGQVVVVGGVHLMVFRLVVLSCLLRLMKFGASLKTTCFPGGFGVIDRYFTLCTVVSALACVLLWQETQLLINQLGRLIDVLGGYFVLRFLIHDSEDTRRTIKAFAIIAVIMGMCMINEQLTHRNIFGLLGGVALIPAVREGQTRSQGAFEVYITAGVFGATLVPLFLWLWSEGKSRAAAFLGMVGATIMTVTSNSSTPLLGYAAGLLGLGFWPMRKRMRAFRWGLVLLLISLHLVMKAPVWALIARIDLTGSSSGYHRMMLVDNCIRHFRDWWLMGVKEYNTWGWDTWDLSNQYVSYALTGGLAGLAMFILVISRGFGALGVARRTVEGNRKQEWLLWCLCAALFAHVVSFFGIGYFDQIQFSWYALLAIISSAVASAMRLPVPHAQEALASSYQSRAAINWGMPERNL